MGKRKLKAHAHTAVTLIVHPRRESGCFGSRGTPGTRHQSETVKQASSDLQTENSVLGALELG